jgi:hypothetical protein
MSMNGEYLRVTREELARAIEDPEWALEFADDVRDTEEDADLPPGKARHITTHKAWQAIAFLLERAGFPVDVVFGELSFAEDEDWGYGPPRYLTVEQVEEAAETLRTKAFDDLIDGVTPADLDQAHVYPEIWDEPDSLEWIRGCYEPLSPFFGAAAADGHAMLLWLD